MGKGNTGGSRKRLGGCCKDLGWKWWWRDAVGGQGDTLQRSAAAWRRGNSVFSLRWELLDSGPRPFHVPAQDLAQVASRCMHAWMNERALMYEHGGERRMRPWMNAQTLIYERRGERRMRTWMNERALMYELRGERHMHAWMNKRTLIYELRGSYLGHWEVAPAETGTHDEASVLEPRTAFRSCSWKRLH